MKKQMIVMSVWKCRGLWYLSVWGLDQGVVLDIAPHYRGHRNESEVRARALAAADLVKRKYPQTADFPIVTEHSPEWQAILAA